MSKINKNTLRLKINEYQEIITNIVVVGLPLIIRYLLLQRMNQLKVYKPIFMRYVAHVTLVAVLCIAKANIAYAGFVMGKETSLGNAYGYSIFEYLPQHKSDLDGNLWFETWLNPIFYMSATNGSFGSKLILVFPQIPKILLIAYKLKPYITDALRRSRQEKKRRDEEMRIKDDKKRKTDNAVYIDWSTKELKRWERAIHDKFITLQNQRFLATFNASFDARIERLIIGASKFKQDILYSSSREITDGIQKITLEAAALDKKIQGVCDLQAKLKGTITLIRQSIKVADNNYVDNYLKFYEELMSPSNVIALISDRRFDDYHVMTEKIIAEVAGLVKIGDEV